MTVTGRPRGAATTTTIAIAEAPTRPEVSAALKPVLIRPEDIRVEVRGAGRSTRQINHVIAPDFPADRLLVVEVLTPAGSWSSWPPHKHDVDDMPREAVLEEIYLYGFRRPEAWAFQRVYRPSGQPARRRAGRGVGRPRRRGRRRHGRLPPVRRDRRR